LLLLERHTVRPCLCSALELRLAIPFHGGNTASNPVGDAKSNQRFRRTEGVFRGHKKPVCFAVKRLVWATDQALQRRRQDVGTPWATNSCTRASPGTHEWYDGTPHPWEFKRVWHLEPSLNDPDTVCKPVMFVPYPKCSEAIVRRLYDTARSSSLPAHRVAAISMAWVRASWGRTVASGRAFLISSVVGGVSSMM
jgi:hypothetical protein